MNNGPIAHRYAKALLKFVQETGAGEQVYSQACVLVLRMLEIPEFADAVQKNSELMLDRKMQLLDSALGRPMQEQLRRFVALVDDRKRIAFLQRMLHSFIEQYRQANSIKVGKLIAASEVSGLKDRLQEILSENSGATVLLEEELNPEILGGFVLELDGSRLDASVAGQLDKIRRELVQNNNRIV